MVPNRAMFAAWAWHIVWKKQKKEEEWVLVESAPGASVGLFSALWHPAKEEVGPESSLSSAHQALSPKEGWALLEEEMPYLQGCFRPGDVSFSNLHKVG